ncbi:MAG: HAMP domain-containing histidine kinase [Bacteroidetes bacterium]|nr:HAMP domain-containing histidine kinase [Bacteroidota bacterium]MBU1116986.1 HAMP domain-containing histidine kinase [Bacteroidota bacterium]MBU1797322.1 HAMP domain-containing histidine kinase [Bacteroidota bacterium]
MIDFENIENDNKKQLSYIMVYVSSIMFPVFMLVSYFQKDFINFIYTASASIIQLLFYYLLKKNYSLKIVYTLGFTVYALIFIYLIITGGINNTGFIWTFVFPMSLSIYFGKKHGLLLSLIFLILIIASFLSVSVYREVGNYFRLKYIAVYLLVVIISYSHERIKLLLNNKLKEIISNLQEKNNELLRKEKELKFAKDAAIIAEQIKSEFLAQMSHEIRTPINIITGNSGYIKEMISNDVDSEIIECFNSIEIATSRIIRTTDLIINASELQTGGFQPIFANIDLNNTVLKRLFDEYQKVANQKGLEFIYKCEPKEFVLFGDDYSLNQIFANLIDNAIKYTAEGKVEIVLSKLVDKKIMVEIKDTGIGINTKFKEQMFHPFAQEEQGYKRKFDGNGLGLTLVKGYLDLHKAKIEVESSKNIGSTFRIIFDQE